MAQSQKQEQGNQLALIKKDVVDVVSSKVSEFISRGELHLPPNYSPENAMKSAWLKLQSVKDKNQKPALAVCTKNSIANALLDMVVQGLNPDKNQCYFVVYGDELVLMRSYFGTAAVAKRALGLHDLVAMVVYEGDEFEYEISQGRYVITNHVQKAENIKPDKIKAAYCIISFPDHRQDYTEIMTIEQIKKSWAKSKADQNKPNSTHKEFPDQMAKRTVIARACKLAINMTGDDSLLIESFNRSTKYQDDPAETLEAEAELLGNTEEIDIELPEEEKQEAPAPDPDDGLTDKERADMEKGFEGQEDIFKGADK